MRALVYHAPYDVRCDQVPDACLADKSGAVVRVTCSSICGSDLHLYHGTVPGEPGTIIGHECVGVIEDVGSDVQRFRKGDRVIVPGVVGCGSCPPCRRGYPVGCMQRFNKVYGFSRDLPGGQAEAIAVPNADVNLWNTPSDVDDEQVLFLTDILPTGFWSACNARIRPGQTVVVLGCGPVGLFAILCAQLFGPARVFAVDKVDYRLDRAREYGAIPVNADREGVHRIVTEATEGCGADAVIEAIGSTDTIRLAIDLVRTGGVVSVAGVLIDQAFPFPLGTAFMKDVTFRVGLCNVPEFIPQLLPLIRSGRINPAALISHRLSLNEGSNGYDLFDRRQDGCLKVILRP